MDVGEFLNFEDDAFQLLRKLLVPKCGILIKTCIKFSTNAALRVAAVVISFSLFRFYSNIVQHQNQKVKKGRIYWLLLLILSHCDVSSQYRTTLMYIACCVLMAGLVVQTGSNRLEATAGCYRGVEVLPWARPHTHNNLTSPPHSCHELSPHLLLISWLVLLLSLCTHSTLLRAISFKQKLL